MYPTIIQNRMMSLWWKFNDEEICEYYENSPWNHVNYPLHYYGFFEKYGRDTALLHSASDYVILLTQDSIKSLWLDYLGLLLEEEYFDSYFLLKVRKLDFPYSRKYKDQGFIPILTQKRAKRFYPDHSYIWEFVDKYLGHLKDQLYFDFCKWNFACVNGININVDPFYVI